MNERTRLYIHTAGVIIVFTIIIFMRYMFSYQGNVYGFIKSEFVFYAIGITFILIFTQFLIGTTFSSKFVPSNIKEKGESKNQKELRSELHRLRLKLSEQKKKNNSLLEVIRKEEGKFSRLLEDFEKLKSNIQKSIVSDRSILDKEIVLTHPSIHLRENYFFTSLKNLEEIVSRGIDSYQLESSIAYMSSYQLYSMLTDLVIEVEGYDSRQVDQLLNEYASMLNKRLKYVDVINYGYENVFEDSSHKPIGFVDEYDQVHPKCFKVLSKDTGGIIYKALVQKV